MEKVANTMLELREFAEKRPFLFHTTPVSNLETIRKHSSLLSAKAMTIQAKGKYVRGGPRQRPVILDMPDGMKVTLRDQKPLLRLKQLELEDGFTIEDLVELLDSYVFFWSGEEQGFATSAKYEEELRALIRVRTADLFKVKDAEPLFCSKNSGGPRAASGKPSIRGRHTFVRAGAYKGPISSVREVVFQNGVLLPNSTQVRLPDQARFTPLF